MKKYIWALVIANIFDIFVSIIFGFITVVIFVATTGIHSKEELVNNDNIISASIVMGSIVSIAAGFLAAKIAGDRCILMGFLSSTLCMIEGINNVVRSGFSAHQVLLFALGPILGILGAYLYLAMGRKKIIPV